MFEGIPISDRSYQDYLLLVLVLGILGVLWAYYLKPRLFIRLMKASFIKKETEKMHQDNSNTLSQRNAFILNMVFLINLSMMLFLSVRHLNINLPPNPEMLMYLIILGVVSAFYLIRFVVYHVIGFLTNAFELQNTYLQAWMGLNKWYALLLFPALFGMLYLDDTVKTVIVWFYAGLFVLLFLIKLYRGFQIAFANRISFILIFLYLCALELLPVLVLVKYITGII
ncbi:MAG TPA: DUF4271 domain-containing protein [Bacteroidales bacterium]|nr:DUF4271 domain-containing protein [Bacteroidales bacterium]